MGALNKTQLPVQLRKNQKSEDLNPLRYVNKDKTATYPRIKPNPK